MKKFLILVLLVIAAWFFVRFVIGGPEDDWICIEGQWAEHGYPSAPMPEGECDN